MKSRERIISAAIPVFAKKGRHGAHMEEIANMAHINKAMIYYIFHNKDDLYFEVLKFVMGKTWESFSPIPDEDAKTVEDYKNAISGYITNQITFFYKNRDYTKVLVNAMSDGTDEISQVIEYFKETHNANNVGTHLKKLIENGKKAELIRDIDTNQLIISMVGMVIIYFFSDSLLVSLNMELEDEEGFMKTRLASIVDIVMNGIMTGK